MSHDHEAPLNRATRLRRQLLPALGGGLLAVSLLVGCSKPEPTVHYDLAADAAVADRLYPSGIVVTAAPAGVVPGAAEGALPAGASSEVAQPSETTVFVEWPSAEPRLALLDIESEGPGIAIVRLGDMEVGRLEVEAGRRRVPLGLPAEPQKRGRNLVRVALAAAAAGEAGTEPSPVPRLLDLVVGSAESAPLRDLAARDLAGVDASRAGGVPSLLQAGPSTLRYAVRLPQDAVLRFTPQASPESPGPVRFRASISASEAAPKQIWSLELSPGATAPEEVSVPLAGAAGELRHVLLSVDGGAEDRFALGVWTAPRIMGRGPSTTVRSTRLSEEEAARADGLREDLGQANVVLVVLAAVPAEELGCYGSGGAQTPEVDRIAAEGVVFERAYAPASFGPASLGSIWTSRYPSQHRAGEARQQPLPNDHLTVAELLTAQGIQTAGFVTDRALGRQFALDRGFAEFVEPGGEAEASGDGFEALAGSFERWIEKNGAGRFLAYVQVDGSGDPSAADRGLGRIRKALEVRGLWDRTVVIVTSDGGARTEEAAARLEQATLRVPLILRIPGGPSGRRAKELTDLLDVAPTIADVFGVLGKGGTGRAFEGRSLLAVLEGAPGKPALLARSMGPRPSYALQDGAFKLVQDTALGTIALYDLAREPTARTDVSAREPLRTAFYRQSLSRWLRDLTREDTVDSAELSPEELETLRALGYVN